MIVDGARCDDHNARTHKKYTKACDIHRAALSMFIRCRWIVVGDTNHWIGYVGLTVCIWPSLSQQANVGMPIGSQCNSISPSCARIRQSSFDRVILVGGRVECRQDSAPLRYGKWVGLTRKKKKLSLYWSPRPGECQLSTRTTQYQGFTKVATGLTGTNRT